MRFLIAGAGLSGLHAAWRLQQEGHDVAVFEARSRVGGRTYSTTLENGVTVDQGALTIRAEDHAVRGLCAELGIELIGIGFPVGRWEVGLDERHTIDEVDWIFEGLGKRAAAQLADGAQDESLHDAFSAVIGAGAPENSTYLNTRSALSVPLKQLSAHGFAAMYLGDVWGQAAIGDTAAAEHGIVEHASRILGGNQRPANELARRLGAAVRLESPIRQVTQHTNGVEFELADGSLEHGDAAVLALPLPLLRKLTLGFELPVQMRRAMAHLTMGASAMASFALEAPFRPHCVNEPTDWWTAATWASPSNELASERAVTAFFGTDDVIDRALEGGPTNTQALIGAVMPQLQLSTAADAVITDWRREEWSLGSYPNWSVGWDLAMNNAFEDRVVGRVAVAGSDTSGAFVGGMEGAVKTGRIAASQLLSKVG